MRDAAILLLLHRSLGDAVMFCTFNYTGEQLSACEMNKLVQVKISLKSEKCILICASFTSRN